MFALFFCHTKNVKNRAADNFKAHDFRVMQFSYMPKLQRQKGMDEKYIKERRIKLTINLSVHTFLVLIFVFLLFLTKWFWIFKHVLF